MNKLLFTFFQLFSTLLFIVFCINASAQNSTVYAITPSSPYSKFIHFDAITGSITYKTTLDIIEELGTSTFDHEAKNYFIAGYRDTICYLLTIHAPSGRIIAEQEINGNSEWHGFEYNYKTKKIYGTRRNLSTYDFYFAT